MLHTFTPGATSPRFGPGSENDARLPSWSTAPTAITDLSVAGGCMGPGAMRFVRADGLYA
jgi:hypothetical protein